MHFKDKQAWFEVEDGRTLTFGQYKAQVDRLTSGLQTQGIVKGIGSGSWPDSLEYFLLFGASAALGAIMLPVNWRLSAEEVRFNLSDGAPRIVFADQEYHDLIDAIKGKLPSVEKYFNLGPGIPGFLGFSSLIENQASLNTKSAHR